MSKKINQTFQELKEALEKYKKAKKIQINNKKPIEIICENIKLKSDETGFEIEYKGRNYINNNSLEEVIIAFIEKFLTTVSANFEEKNYLIIRQLLEERGNFIFKSIPELKYFWNNDNHTLFFRNQQGNILYKVSHPTAKAGGFLFHSAVSS